MVMTQSHAYGGAPESRWLRPSTYSVPAGHPGLLKGADVPITTPTWS